MAAFLDLLRWRRTRRCGIGVDGEDERTFGYLVAELDLDALHHAINGRWHVHRIFGLYRVAGLHEHFDDRDVLEVADVGDFDFD